MSWGNNHSIAKVKPGNHVCSVLVLTDTSQMTLGEVL